MDINNQYEIGDQVVLLEHGHRPVVICAVMVDRAGLKYGIEWFDKHNCLQRATAHETELWQIQE